MLKIYAKYMNAFFVSTAMLKRKIERNLIRYTNRRIAPISTLIIMVSAPFKLARTYALELANNLTKVALNEFFVAVHNQFYPDTDITFMNYFLELTEHEDEFYVHHSKLVEYGIMTSTQSCRIAEKIQTLELVENEDFTLTDVRERGKSGSQNHKHYHLTPKAFKKCLMRAQRRSKQPVDPVIYCDYYLLLEDVFKLYTDYERVYGERLIAMKDDKIDKLQKTVESQSSQIAELLGYAKDTKVSLDEAVDKIDDLKVDNNLLIKEVVQTKEIVKDLDDMLSVKSFVSTRNPNKQGLVHHALVMEKQMGNGYVVSSRSGQSSYIDRCKLDLEEDGFTVLYDKFYQANGIDFRRNVQDAVNARIEKILEVLNLPIMKLREQLQIEIDEHNSKLPQVIDEYNNNLSLQVIEHNKTASKRDTVKLSKNGKRYYWRGNTTYAKLRFYENEERIFEKEVKRLDAQLLRELPIKVCSTYISWKPNEHLSYDELKAIIEKVNVETQSSPRTSFDEGKYE